MRLLKKEGAQVPFSDSWRFRSANEFLAVPFLLLQGEGTLAASAHAAAEVSRGIDSTDAFKRQRYVRLLE